MTVSEVTSTVSATIGRYFNLVSFVPAAIFACFVVILAVSGSWTGPPHWAAAFNAISRASIGDILLFLGAAVLLGLILHPLQFPLVQLYEGYWGNSRLARKVRLTRAEEHAKVAHHAARSAKAIGDRLELTDGVAGDRVGLWATGLHVEYARIRDNYPAPAPGAHWPYMPTRLGNVLRRYELLAGAPYGIRSVQAIPYLALVAEERDVRYLDDQRATLDLVVGLSAMSFAACAAAVLFLWNDGLWLLVALIPYLLGYLLYRGSVAVAHEYGLAMATLIALNRTALYRRLGLAFPRNADAERARNRASLSYLLNLDRNASAAFVEEPDVPGPESGPDPPGRG